MNRVELDDQIARTFKATGAVSEHESRICHAGSGAELRDLLRGNHRYVFTMAFRLGTSHTVLCVHGLADFMMHGECFVPPQPA